MKIIYIDTETTGLNPKTCAIIQLSGIIVADGKQEEFNLFLRPHEGAEVAQDIMGRYGHPLEDVLQYPDQHTVYLSFTSLLSKYVDKFDRQDKFYFVGYNSSFDMDFMREWFARNDDVYFGSWFWFPSIDVMALAAFQLVGKRHLVPNMKLGTIYEYLFNEPLDNAHDSLADIQATRRILNHITKLQLEK